MNLSSKIPLNNSFKADVLDLVPTIIAVHDRDHTILWANKAFINAARTTLDKIVGKKCFSVLGLAEPCRGCPVQRAIETEKLQKAELSPQNQSHWPITQGSWYISANPIKDGNGNVIGAVEAAYEITEQKQIEEKLRESEDKYRALFENASDAIFIADADTEIILEANKMAEKLLGMPRQKIIGEKQSFLHPRSTNKYTEQFISHVRAGQTTDDESVVMDGNGRLVPVRISSTVMELEGKTIVQGIFRDISERYRVEEALRESESRYSALVKGITDAFFVHHITEDGFPGEIIDVNDVACNMLGYTREELIGMGIADIDAPESTVDVQDIVERLKTGQDVLFEQIQITKQGNRIPVEVHAQTFDYQGSLAILSIARDMTDRKMAEKEKKKIESQLQQAQKMESIGNLAGGVAHDFNNMLSVIFGHVEIAMEMMEPDDPLREELRAIREAALRSTNLTRQLLAFARKQTAAPKVLELNETVENLLKMLRRLIGEGIDLTWNPGLALWPIMIDPSQVDQILANLCVNARDAISGIGKVTIETSKISFDETYCGEHRGIIPGDYVMLAVSDNGCGIEKNDLDKIFEPFYTTKGLGKGTGLGLSTVYGIIKQNNGFIDVDSEPGHGSTFKIFLPKYLGIDETKHHDKAKIQYEKGDETVLLVEDEKALLDLSVRMAESLGYNVLSAVLPSAAMQIAEEYPEEIHLLITDVVMPEMNGRELEEKICILRPEMKCLFMSGYTADVIAHHGVINKNVNFIQKPFSKKKLAKKIRAVLDKNKG